MDLAGEKICQCNFIDAFFTKNVPHLLEKISLYLDYTSFKNCLAVNKNWKELLNTNSFLKKVRTRFKKEVLDDKNKLVKASRKGNVDEVRKLVWSGILDVNCLLTRTRSPYISITMQSTPLCMAAKGGHKKVLEILLDKGADCNKTDGDGFSPLHMAARFGNEDIVKMFLDIGADHDIPTLYELHTPLHTVAKCGFIDVAKLLLAAKADIDKEDNLGETPLFKAVISGHQDLTALLLAAGSDPNTTNTGYPGVVGGGWTPLHWTAKRGCSEIAKLLMNTGAEVDKVNPWNDMTPLHCASLFGRIDIIQVLLDGGADCKKKDASERTPLEIAKLRYNPYNTDNSDIVKLLQNREAINN